MPRCQEEEQPEGVVVMASSREGLQRLEDFIEKDEELRAKLKRQPKERSFEVKFIAIDEDLGSEEISRKIKQRVFGVANAPAPKFG